MLKDTTRTRYVHLFICTECPVDQRECNETLSTDRVHFELNNARNLYRILFFFF